VNESVKLVRHARIASAAGFVNAVLRRAAADPRHSVGDETADPIDRMAVQLSHPRWLLERWIGFLGEAETAQLAAANNSPPRIAFRVNTRRATADAATSLLRAKGIVTRPSRSVAGAFVVEHGRISPDSEAVTDGLIYLQDEASQAVSLLLNPRPDERVLDLCAAPGSKTTHLAILANDQAWIVACDRRPPRLSTLMASCRRMRITSVDALAANAAEALPFLDSAMGFDRVLIDAPCTGTGTLRQNPEIKWRLESRDIARLSELQSSLLQQGGRLLRKGGRLVYSTCSIEPEEDELVVAKFLDEHPGFQVVRPAILGDWTTKEGFVRTFPHRDGTDGFFAAVLERAN
jgi:16S rRNA (cytosine967-C5)-methyltransferase